ncbi:MAG: transposase domain-containing protein [Xenococcus sp. MO_188.B8]|nr:transposase domain-containing protein [Xenococcus sp. MO_188.B8]
MINPKLEASLVFQAIQTVISPEIIDQELEKSNSVEERKRKLPASLVVCLVIAMSLWSSDSMGTVLKNLVNGLNRQWTKLGHDSRVPLRLTPTRGRSSILANAE